MSFNQRFFFFPAQNLFNLIFYSNTKKKKLHLKIGVILFEARAYGQRLSLHVALDEEYLNQIGLVDINFFFFLKK